MLAKKLESTSNIDDRINAIITYEQYKHLKNELDLNVRDKLIVMLAWNLFSNEDMKNIKEEDIVFSVDDKTGMDVVYIALQNRTVKFEDPEIVRDIKKCINMYDYTIYTSNCQIKTYQLKTSHYLLKPVATNKDKEDEYLINPSLTLYGTAVQQNIRVPGFDIDNINVENIRISKLIYMIAHRDYFSGSYILSLLKKCDIDQKYLRLYEKMAIKKYGINKKKRK